VRKFAGESAKDLAPIHRADYAAGRVGRLPRRVQAEATAHLRICDSARRNRAGRENRQTPRSVSGAEPRRLDDPRNAASIDGCAPDEPEAQPRRQGT